MRAAILGAAGVLTLGVAGLLYARSQGAQNARPQMSEEAFKDIRVLKGVPVDEFMDVMGMFSASLGYCCTDCHVKEAVGNIGAFAVETPKIQMARRMIAATLEKIGKADEIAGHIGRGIGEAVADAGLGGEMDDDLRPGADDKPVGRIAIGDIADGGHKSEFAAQMLKPRVLELHVIIGREIVEPGHAVAFGEEPLGKMIADEARDAGNQHSHFTGSTAVSGSIGIRPRL